MALAPAECVLSSFLPPALKLRRTAEALAEAGRRPQDLAFRKALFQIHLWTGIGVGLYIFVVGLTGALLMLRSEMQQAAYPQFFHVAEAAGPTADIGTVLHEFRSAYPDQTFSGIDTPTPTRQTFLTYVHKDGRYVAAFAHPATGKVLGELNPHSFVSRLQDLHFELLGGETGRTLNGVGAICLTALALTGLVIWWNRVVSDRWSKLKTHATAAAALFTVLAAGSSRDVFAQEAVFPVSHSGRGAYEASLTRLGDRFAVTWYDTRDGHAQIYLQVIDDRGRSSRPEQRLTNGPSFAYEPDVDAVDSNLAIAWYEKAADGPLTAKLGLWTKDGRLRWSKALSATGHNGRNPVVRASRRRIFCAWIENRPGEGYAVWAQWFDAQGRAAAPPRRLAPAGQTTWNLNAAIDDQGRAWVVFDARVGTRRDELFLVRVAGTRSMASDVVQLSADDGFNSKYPDIAFSGDRAALTWFDERDGNDEVYLFVAPTDDLKQGLEQRAARVTDAPGESIGAYVAWNGGQVGLAWCDNTFGQHEIYVQRFDESGKPIDEPERLTRNDTWSLIPAIRSWRDGFALVWNEFTPGLEGTHGSDGRSEVVFATGARRRIDARQPKQ